MEITQYTGFDIIPLSVREPFIYIEKGRLDIEDGAVKISTSNELKYFPISNFSVILLGVGTSITHEFAKLANKVRTLIVFVGEDCTRLYNVMGYPSFGNKNMLRQFELFQNEESRLNISRKMYSKMFGIDEDEFDGMTIEQMRGAEGYRVKLKYGELCSKYGLDFMRREAGGKSDSRIKKKSGKNDAACNKAMDVANTCLYAACDAVVLSLGLAPSVGFIHTSSNHALSLDIADTIKFKFVTPIALKCASELRDEDVTVIAKETRRRIAREFREQKIINKLFIIIKDIFDL